VILWDLEAAPRERETTTMNLTRKYKSAALAIAGVLLLPSCAATSSADVKNTANAPESWAIQSIQQGKASWYSIKTNRGTKTASGQRLCERGSTAAHKTLPMGTKVRVINLANGKSEVVTINDRGPYVGNRIIDLSHKAARNIEMVGAGTADVRLTIINPDPEYNREEYLQERFTLQVGSFSRPEHAELIAGDLSGSRISEAKIHDRIYYRVYYGLYATRREAESALMSILKKGHSGFVKQL
jgi:rare lipoprotein A